jgi:hypothetical protein
MIPHNREAVLCIQDGEKRIDNKGNSVTLKFSPYTETNPYTDDLLYELFWLGDDGFAYDSYGVAHDPYSYGIGTIDYTWFNHLV